MKTKEKSDVKRKSKRTAESSDHSGRAQLLWTFCVAIAVAFVALQQIATTRSSHAAKPQAETAQTSPVAERFLSSTASHP